jgi:hypothetical protein
MMVVCTLASGCPNKDTNQTTTSNLTPRLEIERTNIDAGETDFSVLTEGKFPVRNGGDATLTLRLESKSCQCSEVLVPSEIGPGQEATIVLRWIPTLTQVGSVRVTCELQTNDPAKPALFLEMRGTVNPLIRLWPENVSTLDFGHFHPGDRRRRELKVFSTKLPAFELDAKTSTPGIRLTKQKLDANHRIGELQPKCAYSLVLETMPELSVGSFVAELALAVKPPDSDARTFSIWLSGAVVDRLFTVSPEEITFTKRDLASGEAQKVRVQFIDAAAHQTLEIVKCEPAFLQCDAPRALPGALGRWEVTVRIPAENLEAAKALAKGFFEGTVVLRASASDVEVPIRVKWLPSSDKR